MGHAGLKQQRRTAGRCALAIGALALSMAGASCIEAPGYVCSANSECIVNNVIGTCDLTTEACVYPSGPACPSGYQNGAGDCVTPGPGVSSSSTTSTANTAGSDTDESDSSDPTTTSTSTSTSGQDDGSGSSTTTSGDTSTTTSGVPCDGAIENITGFGVVGASTVFNGYPPGLSVDGELSTSWFSTGPEGQDVPSRYTWTLSSPRCMSRLFISGNGLNANASFREDFGFESVTFKILNGANEVLFEETRTLAGSPDPDVSVDVPGIEGTRVELEFLGHESEDCGGFSELQVLGGDPA